MSTEMCIRDREYHKKTGTTVLLVSHSMEDIAKYANRVLVMSNKKIAMYDLSLIHICTAHHKTAVIPVDIPSRWEPRAKQQTTGLIAYSADWRRQSRPVRVLYRHQTKNPQTKV